MAPRLTAAAKVQRDEQIVSDRRKGLGWAVIAQRHCLSERQCRTVWAENRDALWTGINVDPVEVVEDLVAQLDGLVEQFALAAESAEHGAVKVGALKGQLGALLARVKVAQAVGMLPTGLGIFRQEVDLRQVGAALFDVLNKHDLPRAVMDDVFGAIDEAKPVRHFTWPPAPVGQNGR